MSKDAFWNSKNIEVRDSIITGEYLGWHSENLKLVNCQISSLQGLCYARNLVLENCTLTDSDLVFEYSCVNADVRGRIDSIKNPGCGKIVCDSIGELILDEKIINPGYTEILCPHIESEIHEEIESEGYRERNDVYETGHAA